MIYYGLYEKEYPNLCIGIFKIYELEKFLNMRKDVIYKAIRRNGIVKCKYLIEKFDLDL